MEFAGAHLETSASSDAAPSSLPSVGAYRPRLIRVDDLRPHEEIFGERIPALMRKIVDSGVWQVPVLVERSSGAIMDGHHRWTVARQLGLRWIPAVVLDYADPRLTLGSWTNREFTPRDVIEAALSGRLLPQKSTRHKLFPPLSLVSVPLSQLADDAPARRRELQ